MKTSTTTFESLPRPRKVTLPLSPRLTPEAIDRVQRIREERDCELVEDYPPAHAHLVCGRGRGC